MDPSIIVDLLRQGLVVALSMMAVLIIPGLIVGLIVSFFQAATQINEMSLSFVPKLFVTLVCLMVFGPWLIKTIMYFSERIISDIPYLIGQ